MGRKGYERRIRAGRPGVGFDFAALWAYRDLLFLLVKRDFLSKYKQSVLGPVWFILQPLLMTSAFTVVFSKVAQLSTDSLPAPLFYMAGLLAWNYFQQTFNGIAATFISNMHIFSKVYFPRLVVPLGLATSNLLAFAVQFAVFACFYGYFKLFSDQAQSFGLNSCSFLLPLLLLQTIMLSVGVGLCIAVATAKYRDLAHVLGLLSQIWLYATPIIYPVSKVPVAWRSILCLNPMTGIVETFRWLLLGKGTLSLSIVLSSVLGTAFVLLLGLHLFRNAERTVVDIA
jgi:lipopolysaccharide transport system permease protein